MEDYASKLRKQKKSNKLNTKRNVNSSTSNITTEELHQGLYNINPMLTDAQISIEEKISLIMKLFDISDIPRLNLLLLFIRKLLSLPQIQPMDFAIKLGYVEKLILLADISETDVKLNSLWALTNMAARSSETVCEIIKLNFHSKIMDYLADDNECVVEQSLWLVGNITGDCAEARDELLRIGLIDQLIGIIQVNEIRLNALKMVCWIISNLFKPKPYPKIERIQEIMMYLNNILYVDNEEVLSDTLWAICYACENSKDEVNLIKQFVSLKRISYMLENDNSTVRRPALFILGSISMGDSIDVEDIINSGCLPELAKILINETEDDIIVQTARLISNIAADIKNHIDDLVNFDCVYNLILLLPSSKLVGIRKEALIAINNIIMVGTEEQLKQLVSFGLIQALSILLESKDQPLLILTLKAIDSLLENENHVEVTNEYANNFSSVGCKEKLAILEYSQNSLIKNKASQILSKYYSREDNLLNIMEIN